MRTNTIKEPVPQELIDRVGIEFYSRWKEYKLGDIAEITSSKRIFFSDYVTSGIPFYRSKEIIEKALGDNISTDLFIPIEKFKEIKEKFGAPVNGDILISAVGERAGIPYCVNNDGDFYFKDGNLIWFRNFNSAISSNFLVYYFNSSIGQQRLESTMIGSAQKALTIIGLKNLEVAFPSFTEQTAIASILSSLDDKINLLHRQNKTLEQLAETLFRKWFVEDAEESWEVGKLDDLVSVKGGTTPSTTIPEYWEGSICWTTPRDLSNHNSVFLFNTERKITEAGLAKIGSGLLPIGTVLLSSRAPIGYLAITEMPVAINQGYIAILCNKKVSNYYIYLWCKANLEEIQNSGNGSVFQEISKTTFKDLNVLIPSNGKLIDFNKMIEPTFQKIKSNATQIRTLTQLRDTLLPKLMSGEVRVEIDLLR
jgi:type I restriction enzyme S subunit